MSWNPSLDPDCPEANCPDSIETIIVPRTRDLGGFDVRRVLPSAKRRMVGPFVFLDQMGPAEFAAGEGGIDVRPHPHIGLATVTFLHDGEFQHRDSLGTNQMIYPGEVNWMIAGHGIAHSERTSDTTRTEPHKLAGIQTWVALPEAHEDAPPAFEHVEKTALPHIEYDGVDARLILGSAYGEKAPVKTFQPMFYLDMKLTAGARIPLPDDYEERAVYIISGSVGAAGDWFEAGQMLVFRPNDPIALSAGTEGAHLMLLGGEAMDGPRHIWWNFVASSKERIEDAKADWADPDRRKVRFPLPPDDRDEFIPLPDN
ncbi:MAG: pirin family protein [Pseudomonadota bacterium]